MTKIKNVSFLPDLGEIEARFIRELINLKSEVDWNSHILDLSVFMFRQNTWRSPFQVGYDVHVTIIYEYNMDIYAVFYDNDFIYILENPNQDFFDDVFKYQKISTLNFSKYFRKED